MSDFMSKKYQTQYNYTKIYISDQTFLITHTTFYTCTQKHTDIFECVCVCVAQQKCGHQVTPADCKKLMQAVPQRLEALIKKNGRRLLSCRSQTRNA